MEVKHSQENSKGKFYITNNNEQIAEMTYSKAGEDKIIIDHTDVLEDYKGQGLGKKLLYAVVEYVRQENKTIIPLCPYAKSVFDKNEDLRDVLA